MDKTGDWYYQAFYRVSVKALIRNDKSEFLTVSEKGSDFIFTGGGWDYGESLDACLKRELKEEVNFAGKFSQKIITAIPVFNPNKDAWQMWVACEVFPSNFNFSVGQDANEIKWMSVNNIDESKLAGQLIRKVLNEQAINSHH